MHASDSASYMRPHSSTVQHDVAKYSILFVGSRREDHDVLRDLLLARSCNIDHAHTAAECEKRLLEAEYDAVVLNATLPDADGLTILRGLTLIEHRPGLLVLSATDDEIDRLLALEVGADDCVAKTCSPREINARVGAILRRRVFPCERLQNSPNDKRMLPLKASFRFAGWILHRESRQLFSPVGHSISLTSKEYAILSLLSIEPGSVKDRASLVGSTDGEHIDDLRSVDVLISRLRKKLTRYGGHELIQTVPGEGYRILG
jgi:DNA-binding response OmpR family regulator